MSKRKRSLSHSSEPPDTDDNAVPGPSKRARTIAVAFELVGTERVEEDFLNPDDELDDVVPRIARSLRVPIMRLRMTHVRLGGAEVEILDDYDFAAFKNRALDSGESQVVKVYSGVLTEASPSHSPISGTGSPQPNDLGGRRKRKKQQRRESLPGAGSLDRGDNFGNASPVSDPSRSLPVASSSLFRSQTPGPSDTSLANTPTLSSSSSNLPSTPHDTSSPTPSSSVSSPAHSPSPANSAPVVAFRPPSYETLAARNYKPARPSPLSKLAVSPSPEPTPSKRVKRGKSKLSEVSSAESSESETPLPLKSRKVDKGKAREQESMSMEGEDVERRDAASSPAPLPANPSSKRSEKKARQGKKSQGGKAVKAGEGGGSDDGAESNAQSLPNGTTSRLTNHAASPVLASPTKPAKGSKKTNLPQDSFSPSNESTSSAVVTSATAPHSTHLSTNVPASPSKNVKGGKKAKSTHSVDSSSPSSGSTNSPVDTESIVPQSDEAVETEPSSSAPPTPTPKKRGKPAQVVAVVVPTRPVKPPPSPRTTAQMSSAQDIMRQHREKMAREGIAGPSAEEIAAPVFNTLSKSTSAAVSSSDPVPVDLTPEIHIDDPAAEEEESEDSSAARKFRLDRGMHCFMCGEPADHIQKKCPVVLAGFDALERRLSDRTEALAKIGDGDEFEVQRRAVELDIEAIKIWMERTRTVPDKLNEEVDPVKLKGSVMGKLANATVKKATGKAKATTLAAARAALYPPVSVVATSKAPNIQVNGTREEPATVDPVFADVITPIDDAVAEIAQPLPSQEVVTQAEPSQAGPSTINHPVQPVEPILESTIAPTRSKSTAAPLVNGTVDRDESKSLHESDSDDDTSSVSSTSQPPSSQHPPIYLKALAKPRRPGSMSGLSVSDAYIETGESGSDSDEDEEVGINGLGGDDGSGSDTGSEDDGSGSDSDSDSRDRGIVNTDPAAVLRHFMTKPLTQRQQRAARASASFYFSQGGGSDNSGSDASDVEEDESKPEPAVFGATDTPGNRARRMSDSSIGDFADGHDDDDVEGSDGLNEQSDSEIDDDSQQRPEAKDVPPIVAPSPQLAPLVPGAELNDIDDDELAIGAPATNGSREASDESGKGRLGSGEVKLANRNGVVNGHSRAAPATPKSAEAEAGKTFNRFADREQSPTGSPGDLALLDVMVEEDGPTSQPPLSPSLSPSFEKHAPQSTQAIKRTQTRTRKQSDTSGSPPPRSTRVTRSASRQTSVPPPALSETIETIDTFSTATNNRGRKPSQSSSQASRASQMSQETQKAVSRSKRPANGVIVEESEQQPEVASQLDEMLAEARKKGVPPGPLFTSQGSETAKPQTQSETLTLVPATQSESDDDSEDDIGYRATEAANGDAVPQLKSPGSEAQQSVLFSDDASESTATTAPNGLYPTLSPLRQSAANLQRSSSQQSSSQPSSSFPTLSSLPKDFLRTGRAVGASAWSAITGVGTSASKSKRQPQGPQHHHHQNGADDESGSEDSDDSDDSDNGHAVPVANRARYAGASQRKSQETKSASFKGW